MKITHSTVNPEFSPIFGMSNMLGKFVRLDGPLNASFYFGSKHAGIPDGGAIPHDIRVKIYPNREKFRESGSFTMTLHGDYLVTKNDLDGKELQTLKSFFRKYKVLFAGAWEEEIIETDITAYLSGRIPLQELVWNMPQYEKYQDVLDKVETIEDLESAVRQYKIFPMHD